MSNRNLSYRFSLADQSTSPYAWMTDGVEREDVRRYGVEQWVKEVARMNIVAQNPGDNDDQVYERWRSETDELDQAVAFLEKWANEEEHE